MTEWQTAAQDYRRLLGWPARAWGKSVWVVAGDHDIEALDVPERLGAATFARLRNNVTAPCVFTAADPDGLRWVFLVARTDPTWLRHRPRLTELGVRHVWAGATLHLPPSVFAAYQLTWIAAPLAALPELVTVAQAVIGAARGEHHPRRPHDT